MKKVNQLELLYRQLIILAQQSISDGDKALFDVAAKMYHLIKDNDLKDEFGASPYYAPELQKWLNAAWVVHHMLTEDKKQVIQDCSKLGKNHDLTLLEPIVSIMESDMDNKDKTSFSQTNPTARAFMDILNACGCTLCDGKIL